MPHLKKPHGWPKLMRSKRLKGGAAGYYWSPPSWAKNQGCSLAPVALGSNFALAKERCDELLNPQFDAWRIGGDSPARLDRPVPGTFNWLVALYKTSPRYKDRPAKTQRSYDSVLRLVSRYKLKDDREFGSLSLPA